jgi:hypothetical protein
MDPAELERVVHGELRRLARPRAPHTLTPRVMAAVRRRSGPWYTRAWHAWPLGWRVATSTAGLAVLALVVLTFPSVVFDQLAVTIARSEPMISAAVLAGRMESVADAAWVLWQYLVQPLLPFVLGFSLLMCAAAAAFGLALSHVAFGRTSS